MFLLWYIREKWSNKHKMQMWKFAILSTHIIWRVGVCVSVQGAYICAHDSPRLSASSKALSGALCCPRSLPFHSPSFCLSVSYLIDLAQKQSEARYLRLRAKAYWCLGEVSPLCLHLSLPLPPMILSRESMSSRSKGSTMMSPYSVGTARSLRHPLSLSPHTHTCTRLFLNRCLDW